MKLLLLDTNGITLQTEGVNINKIMAKTIAETTLIAKSIAKITEDNFKYIKLDMAKQSIICGFEGNNILAIFAESPSEVVEATEKFIHSK